MTARLPHALGLEAIRERLEGRTPHLVEADVQRASVALLLGERQPGETEILFIERAERAGDPWSSHVAFPGGRAAPDDPTLEATAARETLEEVGIDVGPALARLDDQDGRNGRLPRPLVVSAIVFALPAPVVPTPDEREVRDAFWVPLRRLLDPRSAVHHPLQRGGLTVRYPALRHDRFTIWGMTYRILGELVEELDLALPRPE